MSQHARLSPSNHRWPNCPMSVQMEAEYPDVPGEAAIDGTGSHILLETCLTDGNPASTYLGQTIGAGHHDRPQGWLVDEERTERVQICLDYIERRKQELQEQIPNCTIAVESETKSDPGGAFGRDDWWGTVDITITASHPSTGVVFVEVIDYKDGRGWVSEKNNPQLIAYLFGKIRPYIASMPGLVKPFHPGNLRGLRMTIVQPKTSTPIRYVCSIEHATEFSTTKLIEQAEILAKAATFTDDPEKTLAKEFHFVTGKHCKWCKADPKRGGRCSAAAKEAIKNIENLPVETSSPDVASLFQQVITDVKSLSSVQLSQFLDGESGIQAAYDTARAEVQERIEAGESVPGYAMRPGRASRVWNVEEEDIVKALRGRKFKIDDIYPKKLVSPAAALKNSLLNEKQRARLEKDYVSTIAGKLKLTKVSYDQQPEKNVTELFQDVPEIEQPVSFL